MAKVREHSAQTPCVPVDERTVRLAAEMSPLGSADGRVQLPQHQLALQNMAATDFASVVPMRLGSL